MILLIEDNPSDVLLIRRLFDQRHIANPLTPYDNGKDALDYLFAARPTPALNNPLPTLILLDLKLPGMDGLQVLDHIRAHPQTRFIPVIVLTHSGEQEDHVRAEYRGANTCLRKPLTLETFSEAVDNLEMYWLIVNRIADQ